MHVCGKLVGHTDLIATDLIKFVIDKRYADKTRIDLKKCYAVEDGLTHSVRQLLLSHDHYDRYVLNMM